MKRLWAVALAWLSSCTLPVNVGITALPEAPRSIDGGSDAGMARPLCAAAASTLTAYRVTLDPTPVSDPTCWLDEQVPAENTLPAESFEVLLMPHTLLAVAGLSPQRLGNAPEIVLGAGLGPEGTGFEWERTQIERASALEPEQTRHTTAHFEFDRLDTLQTGGLLWLSASWSCGSGADCGAPPDRRACAVVRSFSATRVEPAAAWTELTTPTLEGTRRFLVAIDRGALSRDTVCTGTPPLTRELTPRLRVLEVWQAADYRVRLPEGTYGLPGAPPVELSSDFDAQPQAHVAVRDAGPDAVERRETTATLARPCGEFFVEGTTGFTTSLHLVSHYECAGSGCAAVTSTDRNSCEVAVPYFATEL